MLILCFSFWHADENLFIAQLVILAETVYCRPPAHIIVNTLPLCRLLVCLFNPRWYILQQI